MQENSIWGIGLALLTLVLAALTAIPAMIEVFSWGGRRDRNLVAFAQEVLAGPCDAYERDYWTNTRGDSLKRIEASQAYPLKRRLGAVHLMLAIGFIFSFISGFILFPWLRVSYPSSVVLSVAFVVTCLTAFFFLVGAAANFSLIGEAREKILGITNRKHSFFWSKMRFASLGLFAFYFGMFIYLLLTDDSISGIDTLSEQLLAFAILMVPVVAGSVMQVVARLKGADSLSAESRSDRHLLTPPGQLRRDGFRDVKPDLPLRRVRTSSQVAEMRRHRLSTGT